MIKEEPKIRPAATYGRTEASRVLGISVRCFSNYVNKGLIPIRGINPINNRPFYLGKDIISFWKKYNFG